MAWNAKVEPTTAEKRAAIAAAVVRQNQLGNAGAGIYADSGIKTFGSLKPVDRGWRDTASDWVTWALGDDRTARGRSEKVLGVADVLPVTGDVSGVADTVDLWNENHPWLAAGTGVLTTIGAVGGVIPGVKAGTKAASKAMKKAVLAEAVKKTGRAAKKAAPPTRMTNVPDIRQMPINEAIKAARKEPHLIKSGDSAEGLYIGGPRDFKTRRDLLRQRRMIDADIQRAPEAGDWYDRYRAGVTDVTGGNSKDDLWMSNIEGQYSAGVSPEGELGFSLKDTNSAIAYGRPVKPARPAQQEASIRAIEENDPRLFQLGKKTGEYARRVNPDQTRGPSATGVNDFRHARTLGFTEADGTPQRNAIGGAAHTYSDYETALMVDRANKAKLGGRSDWTGEQIQAVPWVIQKGDDLYSRGAKQYNKRAEQILRERGSNFAPDAVEDLGRELAFNDANRTIADFFPKHTAYATYEAQPYRASGHLPGSVGASEADRAAFAADPRSTWATAPGGRDAIYGGMRLNDTGYAMRTRPTAQMQGMYTPPGGPTEFNPGEVARPLVAFDSGKVKTLPEADRSLLTGAEATRAYVDAQGAGAAHKPWLGGQTGKSQSFFAKKSTPGKLSESEMMNLQGIAGKYGFGDVVDVGEGVTFTNFDEKFRNLPTKEKKEFLAELNSAGDFARIDRAAVDSIYIPYEDAWAKGLGSGAVTDEFLGVLSELPSGTRNALNQNPYIAERALARISRDAEWASKWGAGRSDIETARKIIGSGPGWIERLDAARKSGVVLPALAAALISPALLSSVIGEEPSQQY